MAALRPYLAVWRIPGAPVLLLVGTVARLGLGMTPLAMLFVVRAAADGRYAPAALAGAIYALSCGAMNPVGGRLVDRLGPTPVLTVTALAHPVALGMLLLAAASGELGAIYLAAALAGAGYPPLTGAIRAAWTGLTDARGGYATLRSTALAAEASLLELVFIAGPLLVGAFIVVATAEVGIIFAAVITLVGTLVLAHGRAMRGRRPSPHHDRTRGLGPLRVPGFATVLVCAAGLGAGFGGSTVAVPAYATSNIAGNAESMGAVLFGIWGIGSAIGGIWYGIRTFRAPLYRQFAWLLGGVAAGLAILAIMPNPVLMAILLILGAVPVAPALTAENALVGRIVPATMLSEAYTWLVTVTVAFSSLGSAAAGVIVDQPGGVPLAFLLSGAVVGAVIAVAAWPRGPLARAEANAIRRLAEEAVPADQATPAEPVVSAELVAAAEPVASAERVAVAEPIVAAESVASVATDKLAKARPNLGLRGGLSVRL